MICHPAGQHQNGLFDDIFRRKIMEQKEKELQPQTRAYTVEEIAAILHIGRSSAYTLVKKGYFKSVRIGTAIRISRKSFDEWLDQLEL